MSLIETSELSKSFKRGDETIYALRNVSLKINNASFVSITGPSGSGKSTLLYILGLLDRPSKGEYLLNGQTTGTLTDDARAKMRNIMLGFVFQSFHLLPRLTALRNVAMPLVYVASYGKALAEKDLKERAEFALERVGLKDRMLHLPNELSGGQCQRVAIARALINNPDVIFADEPTGNLDSRSGQDIMSLFHTLHQSGVTIIMVSHDPAISANAERIISVKDGIVSEGRL